MPLNIPSPVFPPVRYSPLQQAFRSALEVGATELFRLPFEKLAAKREVEKYGQEQSLAQAIGINYMKPRAIAEAGAEIASGQVVPEDQMPVDENTLLHANVQPKRIIDGKKYYAAGDITTAKRYDLPLTGPTKTYVDKLFDRVGVKQDPKTPVTEGNFAQIAQSLGAGIEAKAIEQGHQQFEQTRVDAFLAQAMQPGPDFNQWAMGVAFRDPNTGRLYRNMEDALTFSKGAQYGLMLQDPILKDHPEIRRMIEQKFQRAQLLSNNFVFTSSFMPTREDIQQQIASLLRAVPNEASSGALGILTNNAIRFGLIPKDVFMSGNTANMSAAMSYMHENRPLLEAMLYWQTYGSLENMETQGRLGGPLPTNQQVWNYLRNNIFPQGSFYQTPLMDPKNPGAGPMETGPAANITTPATPTTPGVSSALPTGMQRLQDQQGAGAAAAPVAFQGSPAGRLMYNLTFSRTQADPTAFGAMRDSLETAFRGSTADVLNFFRRLAADPNSGLSPADKQALLAQISIVESLPPTQQRAKMSQLLWQARAYAQQGREDALGNALNPKPAAGAGEKPKEGAKKEGALKEQPKEK